MAVQSASPESLAEAIDAGSNERKFYDQST